MTAGEHAICATCGHQSNGHAHQTAVPKDAPLPCNHGDGCEAFVDSGKSVPQDRSGHWPNMWELENHNPGAAA